jgi:hypothetical protein
VSLTEPGVPQGERQPIRAAIAWGVVVGAIQAASPLAFWWLDPATVYAVELAVIASLYIGFAVADGRWRVIAFESGLAMAFPVVASVLRGRRLGRRLGHRS